MGKSASSVCSNTNEGLVQILLILVFAALLLFLGLLLWPPLTMILVLPLIWVTFYLRKKDSSTNSLIKSLNCDHGVLLALTIIFALVYGLYGFTWYPFSLLANAAIALSLCAALFSLVNFKGSVGIRTSQSITLISVPVAWAFLGLALPSYGLTQYVGNKHVTSTIDAEEDGFFVLRYSTYMGKAWCNVSGNANEVKIRNDGVEQLVIEKLELKMTHAGRDITADDAPDVMRRTVQGLMTQIASGPILPKNVLVVPSNEYLDFDFHFANCNGLKRYAGEEIEFKFSIALRAADKQYKNAATFKKRITATPGNFAYLGPNVVRAEDIQEIITSQLRPGDSKEDIEAVIADIDYLGCHFQKGWPEDGIASKYQCGMHETGITDYFIGVKIFVDEDGRFLSVSSSGGGTWP